MSEHGPGTRERIRYLPHLLDMTGYLGVAIWWINEIHIDQEFEAPDHPMHTFLLEHERRHIRLLGTGAGMISGLRDYFFETAEHFRSLPCWWRWYKHRKAAGGNSRVVLTSMIRRASAGIVRLSFLAWVPLMVWFVWFLVMSI